MLASSEGKAIAEEIRASTIRRCGPRPTGAQLQNEAIYWLIEEVVRLRQELARAGARVGTLERWKDGV
jgi:ubiquinone biosynthesis protein UbiJ